MSNKWNEIYPRPQLAREDWAGLNGEWRFMTVRKPASQDDAAWEAINVPFCPESRLSGICRRIAPGETMIYERDFTVPEEWGDRRIILHFGAVDQIAEVFVDGKKAGSHEGGYLPFSMDITDLIRPAEDGDGSAPERDSDGIMPQLDWSEGADAEDTHARHVIRVEAADKLDHRYPWGKQKRDNGGMWYTPVSGIWQSVWMEPVPEEHISRLKIDCGEDWVEIRAYGISGGSISLLGEEYRLAASADADEKCAAIHVDIQHPHPWTPEDPHLYDFTISSSSGDSIRSYFALRTLTIEDFEGYKRLCLNGKPYFFNGLLDQGYWQDGIYTPESPEKYAGDILAMKSLGFNTLRKHIKVEADRYYYDCDRLGMVVFQDMVNNGNYSFLHDTVLPTIGIQKLDDSRTNRGESREIFLKSMEETVRQLYNHPSICYWTIFNEGWGQFEADSAYLRLKELDSSRFIDSTSGWFRQSRSDVDSYHVYFKPVSLTAGDRPLVLSEFGGYACKLPDHCYNRDKTYGYKKCATEAELLGDMCRLYKKEVLPMIDKGLCAAIYTQLSDVEEETNGILTYDREILKFRSYIGTGRIEVLGNHTDHQGGKVMVAPTPYKIKAYVAENHSDVIRIMSEGYEPFEVSITDRSNFRSGTTAALVTGILEGFADLFGQFEGSGNGFDAWITSEVAVGSGLSSSAAFEILLCRIVNERYYGGKADAVQLAKIAMFAEREFFGKPCGMMDQLAISLGKLAMIDFNGKEPEIELLDFDFSKSGYEIEIVTTESDHAGLDAEYASVPEDMFKVAAALGVSRLGDINEEQFRRAMPMLEEKVRKGRLTQLQLDRARHFFDENERVLAASVALKTGNMERFLQCINESGLSSENLLRNVVPPGVSENGLSRALKEYKAKPDTAAVRLIGGGFGGSILVFRKKEEN